MIGDKTEPKEAIKARIEELLRELYDRGENVIFTDFGVWRPIGATIGSTGETMMATASDTGSARVASPLARPPYLGETVIYRSRTGDYALAATVARTCRSTSPEALQRATEQGRMFLVPLRLLEVDLVVFTAGGGGAGGGEHGTYVEHAIAHDPSGAPGTWCWPEEVADGRP